MDVKHMVECQLPTCCSTGVHDAGWVLSLGRRGLRWIVNPNLLKVSKAVHLDTLQPCIPSQVKGDLQLRLD